MDKVKILSLLMSLLAFTSCSSDDEPANLASELTGNYAGYTVASCGYFSDMVASDQSVTITSTEINKVDISYQSDTWGTVTINGAELKGSEGNIHISGIGKSEMSHAGYSAKEYECSVDGTLSGHNLELTFTCAAVMGGLKIVFSQGDIPAEIVVPGTYKGYTEAKSAYFSGMMADDQTIVVTKNTDDSYRIDFTSDTWGAFTIEKAEATLSAGVFTVNGEGVTKMGMNGDVKDYACSVVATIDADKNSPVFTFSVPGVMGGLSIIFHQGEMPATE